LQQRAQVGLAGFCNRAQLVNHKLAALVPILDFIRRAQVGLLAQVDPKGRLTFGSDFILQFSFDRSRRRWSLGKSDLMGD